jgi:hypothetical protein
LGIAEKSNDSRWAQNGKNSECVGAPSHPLRVAVRTPHVTRENSRGIMGNPWWTRRSPQRSGQGRLGHVADLARALGYDLRGRSRADRRTRIRSGGSRERVLFQYLKYRLMRPLGPLGYAVGTLGPLVCVSAKPFVTKEGPRRYFGGTRREDSTAIGAVVVPTSAAARRLRAFQQSPHRQTAVHRPSRVCSRVKRHPKELVSVRSGLVSGEQTPQSAQVSTASISDRRCAPEKRALNHSQRSTNPDLELNF